MTQKKKILFIMTALNGGGAEKVLVTLLQNIDFARFDIELLLTRANGVHLSTIPQNIKVKAIFKSNFFRRILLYLYRKIGSFLLIKIHLHRLCKQKYDAIVSFMEGEALFYHASLVDKSKNNIAWVHTNLKVHNWPKWFFYQNDDEKFYSLMQQIVFVSNNAQEGFDTLFPNLINIRKSVINNIVDVSGIIAKSKEYTEIIKRKVMICTLARLSPPKALDKLILAAKILNDQGYDFEVWILGIGPLYEELKVLIAKNDLNDVIKLLGFFANPYPILKQADIFVCTSIVEGFPIAISEALVLGLPVVATNIPAVSEILENGIYGVLTESIVEDIAQKLALLITDVNVRRTYSAKSLVRSEQLFQLQNQLRNYYNVFCDNNIVS